MVFTAFPILPVAISLPTPSKQGVRNDFQNCRITHFRGVFLDFLSLNDDLDTGTVLPSAHVYFL